MALFCGLKRVCFLVGGTGLLVLPRSTAADDEFDTGASAESAFQAEQEQDNFASSHATAEPAGASADEDKMGTPRKAATVPGEGAAADTDGASSASSSPAARGSASGAATDGDPSKPGKGAAGESQPPQQQRSFWEAIWLSTWQSPLILGMWVWMAWRFIGRWRNSSVAGNVFKELQQTELGRAGVLSPNMEELDYNQFEKQAVLRRENEKSGEVGLSLFVQTARRSDIFYSFLFSWFSPEIDRLVVEMAMPSSLEPICAAIFRKGCGTRAEHHELRQIKLQAAGSTSPPLVVVSDTHEFLSEFQQEVQQMCVRILKRPSLPWDEKWRRKSMKGFAPLQGNLAQFPAVVSVHVSRRYQRFLYGMMSVPPQRRPALVLTVDLAKLGVPGGSESETTLREVGGNLIPRFAKLGEAIGKFKLPEMVRKKLLAVLVEKTADLHGGKGKGGESSSASGGSSSGGGTGTATSSVSLMGGGAPSTRKNADLEQAARQRKLEKMKEEKERVAKMSAGEQSRYEEKERQRELKKRMMGGGKVKRMAVAA